MAVLHESYKLGKLSKSCDLHVKSLYQTIKNERSFIYVLDYRFSLCFCDLAVLNYSDSVIFFIK
jgi:hypothetical protein